MKANRTGDLRSEVLAAYVDGEVTPSEASAVERQLAQSTEAQRRVEVMRDIRAVLGRIIPEHENVDLAPLVRQAISADAHRPRYPPGRSWIRLWLQRLRSTLIDGRPLRRRLLRWAPALAIGGAATLVAVVARVPTNDREVSQPDHDFRAKSALPSGTASQRWAAIQVYGVARSGAPRPLVDRMSRGDGLIFSYSNLGPHPFTFMMIFGVDAGGEVRWFHPAYESAGTDPKSISIRRSESKVQLPDLIHHDLPAGPFTLYALFTMTPRRVVQVEATLAGRSPSSSPTSSSSSSSSSSASSSSSSSVPSSSAVSSLARPDGLLQTITVIVEP